MVEGDHFDCSILVQGRLYAFLVDYVDDLGVEDDTDLVTAWLPIRTGRVGAARRKAFRVCGRECSTIEGAAEDDFIRADVVAPEQVHYIANLGEVGMGVQICASPYVPESTQISP